MVRRRIQLIDDIRRTEKQSARQGKIERIVLEINDLGDRDAGNWNGIARQIKLDI